jgi:hypothetical protein
MSDSMDEWRRSVIRVGGGRGFVVETERENRFIITAAHCLPHLPPSHAASELSERTYANLIGPWDAEPTGWAECVFVDPVADLAILGSPDGQELADQAAGYGAVSESAHPLLVAGLTFVSEPFTLSDGTTFLGPPRAESEAWLLSLDERWFPCRVTSGGRGLWIVNAAEPIRVGMSGSPVVAPGGQAIGVVCVSAGGLSFDSREGGPNPELAAHLPGAT